MRGVDGTSSTRTASRSSPPERSVRAAGMTDWCPAAPTPRSRWSINSTNSFLSINSNNSVLSIGSVGSALSVRSVGSFGSFLAIGVVPQCRLDPVGGSVISVLSARSALGVRSTGSRAR